MPHFRDLLARKAELDKQIESLGREERSGAIARIKALMADHGLMLADLGRATASTKKSSAKGSKLAAKYRDPASGSAWSGRGLKPKWLKAAIESGESLEDFAV